MLFKGGDYRYDYFDDGGNEQRQGYTDVMQLVTGASTSQSPLPFQPPPAKTCFNPSLHCATPLPQLPPPTDSFSSDVTASDDSLPFILNIALANVASLAGLLAVLCYAAPPLLPLLLPLAWMYRCVHAGVCVCVCGRAGGGGGAELQRGQRNRFWVAELEQLRGRSCGCLPHLLPPAA